MSASRKSPRSNNAQSGDGIVTAIPYVPITEERPVWRMHKNVKEAGMARASAAVTEDNPEGTTTDNYTRNHSNQTVMQQHVDYFDLNRDGVITPFETAVALRMIGWNYLLVLFALCVIHGGLSYATQDGWFPDPLFRIYIRNIHGAKHGSDSATFDNEGRFRPQAFEDFFSKYGHQTEEDGEWGLTLGEALRGVQGQRCAFDLFGQFAGLFEWVATYLAIWPADGVMRMREVRGVFDGSYFHQAAARVKATGKNA